MRGFNRCGEISIAFVPDGVVPGTRRQKMWKVLADGRPITRSENPQFPPVDNTRGLSLVWQGEQLNLLLERLKET